MARFSLQCVLCLVVTQACTKHVSLHSTSSQASSQHRIAAFTRLHSASLDMETIVSRSGNNFSTDTVHSLVLANGETVYHAEDILPVLDEDTPSARKARDAEASSNASLLFKVGAAVLGTVGFVLLAGSVGADEMDRPTTGGTVGLGMLLGSGLSYGISYYYRSRAKSDTKAAFATYDASLLTTLDLCYSGGGIQDCSGGSVASEVFSKTAIRSVVRSKKEKRPSEPEIGSFKLLKKPDVATGTTSILFRYTAAPGVILKFNARDLGGGHFNDTVSVSVVCEGLGKDQFTDESMLALVFSKENTLLLELNRRVNQLRNGVTQEVVQGNIRTEDFIQYMGSFEGLEFRVGKLVYALPSNATARLSELATYIAKQEANLSPSSADDDGQSLP